MEILFQCSCPRLCTHTRLHLQGSRASSADALRAVCASLCRSSACSSHMALSNAEIGYISSKDGFFLRHKFQIPSPQYPLQRSHHLDLRHHPCVNQSPNGAMLNSALPNSSKLGDLASQIHTRNFVGRKVPHSFMRSVLDFGHLVAVR